MSKNCRLLFPLQLPLCPLQEPVIKINKKEREREEGRDKKEEKRGKKEDEGTYFQFEERLTSPMFIQRGVLAEDDPFPFVVDDPFQQKFQILAIPVKQSRGDDLEK